MDHPPSHRSQFHLFRTRRFAPLFVTMFLGAFNDNLFKNALLVLVVTGVVASGGFNIHTLVNLASVLFILPFFLFSPLAGQLADKYEKSVIIRWVKLAEIAIMSLGVLMLYFSHLWGLLLVLFAMGMQSTFFGPIKYSILPQHLHPSELVGGNAQLEMGTFVAILVGTMLGSLLAGLDNPVLAVGSAVLATAVAGWLGSRHVPVAQPHAAGLAIDWNLWREMGQLFGLAREQRTVWLGILGISWFWLLGLAYLTQVPAFAVEVLKGEARLISLLLGTFTLGIGLGSMLCDRLSGHKLEIGIVPLGSLGLTLSGIDLYFAATGYAAESTVSVMSFVASGQGLRVLADLLLIGAFGGLYIVPLYTLVQSRTAGGKRARVIACNNVVNALFMVMSGVLGILLLGVAGFSLPQFFLLLAMLNGVVALLIFRQVPEFTMRFLVWLITHSLYRVHHHGLENIPGRGGAVIVCNHVSYMDAPILAGAIRRPIRFVMYKPIYDMPGLNFIFKTGGAIPVCSREEDEQAYEQAMAAIASALRDGELLCLFPEGRLTRDGDIGEFRRGIERMVADTPVPVIPAALQGLWGSFFSHDGGLMRRGWKLLSRVDMVVGEPVPADRVTAADLQQRVARLRGSRR